MAINSGLVLGKGTKLVGSQAFGSEPFLIAIGEQCLITDGVKFITHDGSIQVPLISNGSIIDDVYSKKSTFARICIGDNVFIGIDSIILPGTNIGSNSIVAAGSVVKGAFSDGVVIAGNPGRVICNVEDFYNRNKDRLIVFSGNSESRKASIIKHMSKLES